jgi:hypothetical protein
VRDVLSEIGVGVAAESTFTPGLHGAFATPNEAVEAAVIAQKMDRLAAGNAQRMRGSLDSRIRVIKRQKN